MPLNTRPAPLIAQFNSLQGRLRVSVTHSCQLHCQFCHREGIAQHWQPIHMPVPFFHRLAQAYASLGGLYLEITGGEPTLHPHIGQLVEIAAHAGCRVILCTNGLRMDRLSSQIHRHQLTLIRLSLHYGSSAPTRACNLLGPAWDFERIHSNSCMAIAADVPIQIIFTHTRDNHDQLDDVLQTALRWRADAQIVDLITSRGRDLTSILGYLSGSDAEIVVGRYARLERVISDRTGAVLRLFRAPNGAAWEVKDYHFGVLHSAMCRGCRLRAQCGEGVYALRIDALGTMKPCLLRDDLECNILDKYDQDGSFADVLGQTLAVMLDPPLAWNYNGAASTSSIPEGR